MRLVVVEYVSLDGVVQAPGDTSEDPEGGFMHGGWTAPFMAEHRRYNTELFLDGGRLPDGPADVRDLRRVLANGHR